MGGGVGTGLGAFLNFVFTTGDVNIDDFGGTGLSVSGSGANVNGALTVPTSIVGIDQTKAEKFDGAESRKGGIIEVGVSVGVGAEMGVTVTSSEVYKTNIIKDVVNTVSGWFE